MARARLACSGSTRASRSPAVPSQYAGVLPDRITIYQQAICAICRTEEEVAGQVRRTVIHEIGHYCGIDDTRLRELGW
jgi:predicted Zn-dependent protease with MMP-like domain